MAASKNFKILSNKKYLHENIEDSSSLYKSMNVSLNFNNAIKWNAHEQKRIEDIVIIVSISIYNDSDVPG